MCLALAIVRLQSFCVNVAPYLKHIELTPQAQKNTNPLPKVFDQRAENFFLVQ